MPDYHYRIVDHSGRVSRGTMAASDPAALTQHLAHHGQELLTYRLAQSQRFGPQAQAKPATAQLRLYFTQLAELAAAGMPLGQILTDTIASLPDGTLKDATRAVSARLQRGDDLATACAAAPAIFDRTILAVLQAGMSGGDLALGLAKARDHFLWRADFRALMLRSLRYPLFLMLLTFGVISFMMLQVVPQLTQFLTEQNQTLPWHSKALIGFAKGFAAIWWLSPLLALLLTISIKYAGKFSPSYAAWQDRLWLRLPWIGDIIRQGELALFLHHLALLTASGGALLPALRTAHDNIRNLAIKAQIAAMIERVAAGQDLTTAWRQAPILTGAIAQRVAIGLQSGMLAAQLQQASQDCTQHFTEQSKGLIRGLEPALTLLVGVILIWIVLAVLGPIYGAVTQLGR
jgi:type IV pilus assembly protein PilC